MPRKRPAPPTSTANPPSQRLKREADHTSRFNDDTLKSAVAALLKDAQRHEKKRAKRAVKSGKTVGDIMPSEIFTYLAVTLKQPPFKPKLRPYTIPLKHSIHNPGEDDVCFIVKDPQRQIKDYLATHGPTAVTRVLGIEKLRKRYKTHEGRRELLNMYDLFLVDNRVAPMMPGLLGNAFLESKKMPLAVDMRKDVVKGIEKAMNGTPFVLRQGTSLSVKIGRADFGVEELVENVKIAMDGVVQKVEGGWHDVQSVNIKTNKSPALPIYVTLPTAMKAKGKKQTESNRQESKEDVKMEEKDRDSEEVDAEEENEEEKKEMTDGEAEKKDGVTPQKGKKKRKARIQKEKKEQSGSRAGVEDEKEEWGEMDGVENERDENTVVGKEPAEPKGQSSEKETSTKGKKKDSKSGKGKQTPSKKKKKSEEVVEVIEVEKAEDVAGTKAKVVKDDNKGTARKSKTKTPVKGKKEQRSKSNEVEVVNVVNGEKGVKTRAKSRSKGVEEEKENRSVNELDKDNEKAKTDTGRKKGLKRKVKK